MRPIFHLFLMLINGGVEECSKVKIYLSKPRVGKILLNSSPSGKESRGGRKTVL